MNFRGAIRTMTLLLVMAVAISACNAISVAVPPEDASAASVMPPINGYTRVNTADIQGTLVNVLSGGAVITGNPEVAAFVKLGERVLTCYQKAGAIESSVYTNASNPLLSGVI